MQRKRNAPRVEGERFKRASKGNPRFLPTVSLSAGLLAASFAIHVRAQGVSGASAQESALRERAAEFYSLLQRGKWNDAEKFVCKESLQTYRDEDKNVFQGFQVESVKVAADNQSGQVVTRLVLFVPMIGQSVPMPLLSNWKRVNHPWCIVLPKPIPSSAFPGVIGQPPPPTALDLKFKGHRYSLGHITQGQVKVARFPFANESDHAVKIAEVITGCDCLRVKLEKKEFQPGESGEVVVEFDSSNYLYQYGQTMVLKTNPGAQVIELTITAIIDPPQPAAGEPHGEQKNPAANL